MRVVSGARTRAWYDPRLTDGSIVSQVNAVILCMYTHVCVCVCNLHMYVQGINEPGSGDRGVSAKGAWQDASTAARHRQQASAHPTDKRQQAYTYPTDANISPVTHAMSLSSLQSSPLDFEDALRAAGFRLPVRYPDSACTDPSCQADDCISPKRLGRAPIREPTPQRACTDTSCCQGDDCRGPGAYAARPRPRTRRLASKRQAETRPAHALGSSSLSTSRNSEAAGTGATQAGAGAAAAGLQEAGEPGEAGKVGRRGGLGAMPGASAPFGVLTDIADECWT